MHYARKLFVVYLLLKSDFLLTLGCGCIYVFLAHLPESNLRHERHRLRGDTHRVYLLWVREADALEPSPRGACHASYPEEQIRAASVGERQIGRQSMTLAHHPPYLLS